MKDPRQRRLERIAYSAFGLLPMAVGGFVLKYCYMVAGIVNPSVPPAERHRLIASRLLAMPAMWLGLLLVAAGFAVLLSAIVRPHWAAVGAIVAAIGVCLLVMMG